MSAPAYLQRPRSSGAGPQTLACLFHVSPYCSHKNERVHLQPSSWHQSLDLTYPILKLRYIARSQASLLLVRYILAVHLGFDAEPAIGEHSVTLCLSLATQKADRTALLLSIRHFRRAWVFRWQISASHYLDDDVGALVLIAKLGHKEKTRCVF